MNIIFDMETADPDDYFTLCLLTSHPQVQLRGVTVTPGTDEQVGLVKHVLQVTGHEPIPVGSRTPGYDKQCVSRFHYDALKGFAPQQPDGFGYEVLHQVISRYPDVCLVSGAALHNPYQLLQHYPGTMLEKWVAQGGFAGDSVVPEAYQLGKFKGKETCATFNFNGCVDGAFALLESATVKERMLVSKNVCHGVVYDRHFHAHVAEVKDKTPGLRLIYDGMEIYLGSGKEKKFHDPLAACVAIDPGICRFEEVEMYRKKGEWGARLQQGTNTFISISVDMERFMKTLTEYA